MKYIKTFNESVDLITEIRRYVYEHLSYLSDYIKFYLEIEGPSILVSNKKCIWVKIRVKRTYVSKSDSDEINRIIATFFDGLCYQYELRTKKTGENVDIAYAIGDPVQDFKYVKLSLNRDIPFDEKELPDMNDSLVMNCISFEIVI